MLYRREVDCDGNAIQTSKATCQGIAMVCQGPSMPLFPMLLPRNQCLKDNLALVLMEQNHMQALDALKVVWHHDTAGDSHRGLPALGSAPGHTNTCRHGCNLIPNASNSVPHVVCFANSPPTDSRTSGPRARKNRNHYMRP
jgi:hypothetical protein